MLTIDTIVYVFSITLLNPFLATLVPISMYLSTPVQISSSHFRAAVGYCLAVYTLKLVQRLDRRLRQGTHGRMGTERRWSEDVVVITGGASGLGHTLSSILSMMRCKVIVLDRNSPVDPIEGVAFVECDVGLEVSVDGAKDYILQMYGPPTVLISNAGVMHASPILRDVDMSHIDATLAVNLRAQFLLARAFLPDMMHAAAAAADGEVAARPRQWVTIASTLGHVGVHALAAYCASKAGSIALHESLTAELADSGVVTTLVVPGQIDTPMFREVRNPSPCLAPTLDVLDLAQAIVGRIERCEAGEFGYPLYANYMGLMRVLPSGVCRLVRALAGMDAAAKSMSETALHTQ